MKRKVRIYIKNFVMEKFFFPSLICNGHFFPLQSIEGKKITCGFFKRLNHEGKIKKTGWKIPFFLHVIWFF